MQAEAFYEYEDVPDSDEEMSIGHGSASDLSEASSQDASALSHVTVEEDTVEASSRATDAVAPQVDAQPSSSATAVNESDDVHKTVEAESQQSQLQRDDTAAYVNGVSGGLHLNGHGQPEPAATEESRHVPTYVEASQLAQEQQRADQGHGADPAEDSGIKHQAAAVFDPQAAKEAAAADEAVGAVADEPGTAADELVQHAQENPNCNGDLNATTPVLADISKSATPGTAKPLPTRSSSRHIQSQAKTAPWR